MPAELKSILRLEVPLIVVIGSRKMAVREVLSLAPGAIVELPKPADDELEILVNNKPIGTGAAVKVGENFGVRVTFVGNLRDRINALAGASSDEDSADADDKPVDDADIENAVNDALSTAAPTANAA
jgi:flagellar motor switch protein FliN/FliY